MWRYLIVLLFSIINVSARAQDVDSLISARKGPSLVIKYTLKYGENPGMLAIRFYLPDDALAKVNDIEMLKKMEPGSIINIPVLKTNYQTTHPTLDISNLHELYYHVAPRDEIGVLSSYLGVTKADLRNWNYLHGNTLVPGQTLFLGWIKMMDHDSTNAATDRAYPIVRKKTIEDTPKITVLGGLDTAYNRQTNNGLNVLNEKGTAVFFDKPGKNPVFYAFHNSTPRNTVIKVFNPGTNKAIYVKVLGPLPGTKLYANSIIGISNSAREALGVTDSKAWVELSYPAN